MMNHRIKKAVLIIGAGPQQALIGEQARCLGLNVYVTDRDKNAFAAHMFDGFFNCSGDDFSKILDAAVQVNKESELVGIYCGADFCVKAVNDVKRIIGLSGPTKESVELSLDKFQSKLVWLDCDIPTPDSLKVSTIEDMNDVVVNFPSVVKPLNSCGSQGVSLVEDSGGLLSAFKDAQRYSKEVLAEKYHPGFGVDVNGIVWDGRFYPMGLGDRFFSDPPYFYPIWGCLPSSLSDVQVEVAYSIVRDACFALGLDYTPVKADLLFFNGDFKLLEVTPRFHGDVFTTLLSPCVYEFYPAGELFRLMANELPQQQPLYNGASAIWIGVYPSGSFDPDAFKSAVHVFVERSNLTLESLWLDEYKALDVVKNCKAHKDTTKLCGFLIISSRCGLIPGDIYELYKLAIKDFE